MKQLKNYLAKLTNAAKLCAAEVAKSEKQMLQMQDAVANGGAHNLGNIDLSGNTYTQMVDKINEFAVSQHAASIEVGTFDELMAKKGRFYESSFLSIYLFVFLFLFLLFRFDCRS